MDIFIQIHRNPQDGVNYSRLADFFNSQDIFSDNIPSSDILRYLSCDFGRLRLQYNLLILLGGQLQNPLSQ